MRDIKSKDENMINTLEYNPKVPPSILSYEENNNYQQYDDKQNIQINSLDIEKDINQNIIKNKHNFSLKHKKIKHNKSKKNKNFS